MKGILKIFKSIRPEKILMMFFLMLFVIHSEAQRRDHPRRRCDNHNCFCEKEKNGTEWRESRHRQNEPCRRDSTYRPADLPKKENEVDFGEFVPYENPQNPSPTTPDSAQNDVGNKSDSAAGLSFGTFDEFTPYSSSNPDAFTPHEPRSAQNLPWIAGALVATLLAGIFVRYKPTRVVRNIFLIAALVIFGFYMGGCPCPISGIQNVMLAGLGVDRPWQSLLWFLGLIPLTYLFGRVWCGWVCHLGGLQEVLFMPGKFNFLKSEKAQKVMKWIRISLLIALAIQVVVTKSNLYKEIDPFKAIFNLYPANITTWILLVLLLLSSIFIYRPFCRSVCPVGLILGWISKIPGASRLATWQECTSCTLCQKKCESRALTKKDSWVMVDNEDCIRCGDCMDTCLKKRFKIGWRPLRTATA